MKTSRFFLVALVAAISLVSIGAQAAGFDVQALLAPHADKLATLSMLCAGSIELLMKSMDGIETKLKAMSDKADGEAATVGKISADTKTALDAIGTQQRELADRLLAVEQKTPAPAEAKGITSWGEQFIKAAGYGDFAAGNRAKLRVELKNTLVGSDTNVAPQRNAGIVSGAALPFSMEALLPSTSTSSNAIEFTKEASFTNSAAEASEGASKAESALTWSLVNMPVSTVAHWIKISKQLASDAPALAAYVNSRMVYGVNQKVDTQLVVGDGTAPNISGTYDSGNFTAHGYSNATIAAIATPSASHRWTSEAAQISGSATTSTSRPEPSDTRARRMKENSSRVSVMSDSGTSWKATPNRRHRTSPGGTGWRRRCRGGRRR